jgi:hypothetical protein
MKSRSGEGHSPALRGLLTGVHSSATRHSERRLTALHAPTPTWRRRPIPSTRHSSTRLAYTTGGQGQLAEQGRDALGASVWLNQEGARARDGAFSSFLLALLRLSPAT